MNLAVYFTSCLTGMCINSQCDLVRGGWRSGCAFVAFLTSQTGDADAQSVACPLPGLAWEMVSPVPGERGEWL